MTITRKKGLVLGFSALALILISVIIFAVSAYVSSDLSEKEKTVTSNVASDGALKSFVGANTGSLDANIESIEGIISEEEAVSIAYDAITAAADELLTPDNSDVEPEKTGTDVIISDSGKIAEETEVIPFEIYLNEIGEHEVYSCKECSEDTIVWVVKIGIPTNRIWKVGFVVRINAVSGEVLSVDTTR